MEKNKLISPLNNSKFIEFVKKFIRDNLYTREENQLFHNAIVYSLMRKKDNSANSNDSDVSFIAHLREYIISELAKDKQINLEQVLKDNNNFNTSYDVYNFINRNRILNDLKFHYPVMANKFNDVRLHIKPGFDVRKTVSAFYLNPYRSNYYQFLNSYLDECKKRGIPFHVVKVLSDEYLRDDEIVIYNTSETEDINYEIIKNILTKNPQFLFREPPVITNKVSEMPSVGFGEIPKEKGDYLESWAKSVANNFVYLKTNIDKEDEFKKALSYVLEESSKGVQFKNINETKQDDTERDKLLKDIRRFLSERNNYTKRQQDIYIHNFQLNALKCGTTFEDLAKQATDELEKGRDVVRAYLKQRFGKSFSGEKESEMKPPIIDNTSSKTNADSKINNDSKTKMPIKETQERAKDNTTSSSSKADYYSFDEPMKKYDYSSKTKEEVDKLDKEITDKYVEFILMKYPEEQRDDIKEQMLQNDPLYLRAMRHNLSLSRPDAALGPDVDNYENSRFDYPKDFSPDFYLRYDRLNALNGNKTNYLEEFYLKYPEMKLKAISIAKRKESLKKEEEFNRIKELSQISEEQDSAYQERKINKYEKVLRNNLKEEEFNKLFLKRDDNGNIIYEYHDQEGKPFYKHKDEKGRTVFIDKENITQEDRDNNEGKALIDREFIKEYYEGKGKSQTGLPSYGTRVYMGKEFTPREFKEDAEYARRYITRNAQKLRNKGVVVEDFFDPENYNKQDALSIYKEHVLKDPSSSYMDTIQALRDKKDYLIRASELRRKKLGGEENITKNNFFNKSLSQLEEEYNEVVDNTTKAK